jgi:hypothetical protein
MAVSTVSPASQPAFACAIDAGPNNEGTIGARSSAKTRSILVVWYGHMRQ